MDYISRDDVLKAIDYQHEVNNVFESKAAYVQMWETINDDMGIKSADVQPVKRGHWIEVTPRHSKCSICDTTCLIAVYPISKNANYCPNCGADMRGDTE